MAMTGIPNSTMYDRMHYLLSRGLVQKFEESNGHVTYLSNIWSLTITLDDNLLILLTTKSGIRYWNVDDKMEKIK